jgi:hypothetical protein
MSISNIVGDIYGLFKTRNVPGGSRRGHMWLLYGKLFHLMNVLILSLLRLNRNMTTVSSLRVLGTHTTSQEEKECKRSVKFSIEQFYLL